MNKDFKKLAKRPVSIKSILVERDGKTSLDIKRMGAYLEYKWADLLNAVDLIDEFLPIIEKNEGKSNLYQRMTFDRELYFDISTLFYLQNLIVESIIPSLSEHIETSIVQPRIKKLRRDVRRLSASDRKMRNMRNWYARFERYNAPTGPDIGEGMPRR